MTMLIAQALISDHPSLRCVHRVLCFSSLKENGKVWFQAIKMYLLRED